MSGKQTFQAILTSFRKYSFSEHDKGHRFERLMQAYLQTDPRYAPLFANVWLWNDFPSRKDFGGKDTGIDLVAKTTEGDYWAIQCKCFAENAVIDKAAVDSFLSTSSKHFMDSNFRTVGFSHRLWISTTNKWGSNAEETIHNQNPPVTRINLYDLEEAPVDWESLEKGLYGEVARVAKKFPLPHQVSAIEAAYNHFYINSRGKLIMACGTGKTFTSQKIAERITGGQGLVLFLVPSIALLSQTLREWTAEATEPINPICICSDAGATKKQKKNEDSDGYSVVDLALPASTDVKSIVRQFNAIRQANKTGMTVVFSTYQSIEVIAKAQEALLKEDKDNPYGEFDLIISDEAHRTTGVTLAEADESAFVKVHDNDFLKAKKRLYMTATPRLFSDDSKAKAAQADAELCSMDDESKYGQEFFRIGFGEAVERDLLSDYKVLILTVSEDDMPPAVQQMVADSSNEINTDDASKLIGCINALSKQVLGDAGIIKESDPEPMRRAVAFCQNIKASKKITGIFNSTKEVYYDSLSTEVRDNIVSVTSDHIDGAMAAPLRDEKLAWLKAETHDNRECRVLTNVRCLSEGVDVPSLDAVLFLSARNSQVDVVQSVGRVMRKAKNKKYGYIIIPVVVPSNVEPDKALDDNDRYKVVWSVLNALRAHDDRFNATINKIDLNKNKTGGGTVIVGKPDTGRTDGGNESGEETAKRNAEINRQLTLQFEQLQSVVFARMVQKVGDRRYWEVWAKDIAQIAERHIERINRLIRVDGHHRQAFEDFLSGLQKNINPSISQHEAVEMLSQHIITKPVFEALFEGYSFVKNNAISMAMQKMLDLLEAQSLEKDSETLTRFYESVKTRASGIDNAEGKQRIIVELYDKFFKTAFPKMVEKLGIVYTPVEVVDFVIRSVDVVLRKEFSRSLSEENVHILEPFVGTGTFITRLLQSGLIKPEDLERKYMKELHANEIVLLAYYIAAVNIENVYHDLMGEDAEYRSFDGICLTDTFQLGETDASEKLFSDMFPQNSERVLAQKKAPLRVIFGNPAYSVGQKSANDNAQNQNYPRLESRIAQTYAAETKATNKNSLYDSYIKAFRWSTDRLDPENGGIIAFVTNGSWIDGNATDGFRKSLQKEFSSIYVFNLRGNCRTQGEVRRKEAGNVFGLGSRTPISITFLVKKPNADSTPATIHYHDIGDYLSREEKLNIMTKLGSVENVAWQELSPNEHGDWLNQRDDVFGTFIPLGVKDDKSNKNTFFVPYYSNGLKTQRDAWCYNSSLDSLKKNIELTLDFYNEQRERLLHEKQLNPNLKTESVLDFDSTKVSWTVNLVRDAERNIKHSVEHEKFIRGLYRPFYKQHLYFSRVLNERVYQQPRLFPTPETKNLLIIISGAGASKEFSALMTDEIPCLDTLEKSQCFPLYYYEERKKENPTLFDSTDSEVEYVRRDGVTDFILKRAQKLYGPRVTKEDVFYYVYGLLHSLEYRDRFGSDLKKMLARIPLVDEPRDFWSFSKAGRKLAELHIGYESVTAADGVVVKGEEHGYFHVEKMRFPSKTDKSKILFNSKVSVENIPATAYEYIVNGKSAIEWIMERYQVTVHKDSGIKNDPNDWMPENSRYILDLLLSVIRVSVETVVLVKSLPALNIATESDDMEILSQDVSIEALEGVQP